MNCDGCDAAKTGIPTYPGKRSAQSWRLPDGRSHLGRKQDRERKSQELFRVGDAEATRSLCRAPGQTGAPLAPDSGRRAILCATYRRCNAADVAERSRCYLGLPLSSLTAALWAAWLSKTKRYAMLNNQMLLT